MPFGVSEIVDAALKLSSRERAKVVEFLLESLSPEAEADIAEAWAAEIARQSREYDEGLVAPIPWEQVRQQIQFERTRRG